MKRNERKGKAERRERKKDVLNGKTRVREEEQRRNWKRSKERSKRGKLRDKAKKQQIAENAREKAQGVRHEKKQLVRIHANKDTAA